MCKIDLNEQLIVFVVYNGRSNWYVSDKEIWFLDYKKRIEAYRNIGYEVKEEYIDERRKDLVYLDEKTAHFFINRIEQDKYSVLALKKILFESGEKNIFESDYCPSLYVNFDKHMIYSMYSEDASYEDYAPLGWDAQYKDFIYLIPKKECYWLM